MKVHKIKYFIGKSGKKYPFYYKEDKGPRVHPVGTKLYANIGNDHLEPQCFDIPKEEYPLTVEYHEYNTLK